MSKGQYSTPNLKIYNLNETGDAYKVADIISNATEEQICDVFSDGINPNMKRCIDFSDLCALEYDITKLDLSQFGKISDINIYQILIDLFIHTKEEKLGNRINFNDLSEDIFDNIKVIQPRLKQSNGKEQSDKDNMRNLGYNKIITEIRNGLMHNKYFISSNRGIYIHNEKVFKIKTNQKENGKYIVEEKPFEIFITPNFFLDIIDFCLSKDRKFQRSWCEISDIDWEDGFDKNKSNIILFIYQNLNKGDLHDSMDIYSLLNNPYKKNESLLSLGEQELLTEFFKIHEFNRQNLEFVSHFLWNDDIRIQFNSFSRDSLDENDLLIYARNVFWLNNYRNSALNYEMLNWFMQGNDVNRRKIWLEDEEIENEVQMRLKTMWSTADAVYKEYKNSESQKFCGKATVFIGTLDKLLPLYAKEKLVEVVKSAKYMLWAEKSMNGSIYDNRKQYLKALYIGKFFINDPTLKLAKPQKREDKKLIDQYNNYIMNQCRDKPNVFWSKACKENDIHKILGEKYWKGICKQYINNLSLDQIIIEANRDKRLSKKKKEILADNIRKVIEKRKENSKTVTIIEEPEHIRNAFAHHNYVIIPGCSKILLKDPSRDDFPDREGVYDLDKLYNDCKNKAKESFLGNESG